MKSTRMNQLSSQLSATRVLGPLLQQLAELRPHQVQQGGARGDEGEKTSGCAGLGTFQLVDGLSLATALRSCAVLLTLSVRLLE